MTHRHTDTDTHTHLMLAKQKMLYTRVPLTMGLNTLDVWSSRFRFSLTIFAPATPNPTLSSSEILLREISVVGRGV